jgi:uncharacterized membrane protein (UPF0127 family)
MRSAQLPKRQQRGIGAAALSAKRLLRVKRSLDARRSDAPPLHHRGAAATLATIQAGHHAALLHARTLMDHAMLRLALPVRSLPARIGRVALFESVGALGTLGSLDRFIGNCKVQVRLFALALLLGASSLVHAQPQAPLPTTRLTAGIHVITAEVAQDNPSRTRGLMFREKLAPNGGMLFVFEGKGVQCMWMRNTLIPLSVAFIDDDGTIVNIEDMKPLDETSQHCSKKPVAFALEMSQGWFTQRGIKAGTKIGGIR